jgi:hypothetical protein
VIPFPDLLVTRKGTYSLPGFTENPSTPATTLTLNHNHPFHVLEEMFRTYRAKVLPHIKNGKTCTRKLTMRSSLYWNVMQQ